MIENQFAPTRFESALRDAFKQEGVPQAEDTFVDGVVSDVTANLRNVFFFYQGKAAFSGLRDTSEHEAMIAVPFFAAKRPRMRTPEKKGEPGYTMPPGTSRLFAVVGVADENRKTQFFEVEYHTLLNEFRFNVSDVTDRQPIDRRSIYLGYPKITEVNTGNKPALSSGNYVRIDTRTQHDRDHGVSRRLLPHSLMQGMIRRSILESLHSRGMDKEALRQQGWGRLLGSLDALADALQKDAVRAFNTAHDKFLDHADRRAVNLMHELDNFTWGGGYRHGEAKDIYSRLSTAPTEEARLNREIALATLTRLGITKHFSGDTVAVENGSRSSNSMHFWKQIDQGAKVQDLLEAVDPAAGKLCKQLLESGVEVPHQVGARFFDHRYDEKHSYAEEMSELIKLSIPQTRQDWIILNQLISYMFYLNPNSGRRDEKRVPVAQSPGIALLRRTWAETPDVKSWTDFYEKVFQPDIEAKSSAKNVITHQLQGVPDVFRTLYAQTVKPCLLRDNLHPGWEREEKIREKFDGCFRASVNLKHMLDASAYLKREKGNIAAQKEEIRKADPLGNNKDWLALKDAYIAPNKVILVAITSDWHLFNEAHYMKMPDLFRDRKQYAVQGKHVFRLEGSEGQRLGIALYEERGRQDDRSVYVKSIHGIPTGKTPAEAPDDAQIAAGWFAHLIQEGEIKPDFEAIQKRRGQLAQKLGVVKIGFDFTDPEVCDKVYGLYRLSLPKSLEKAETVGDFFRAIKFDAALKETGIAVPPQSTRPERKKNLKSGAHRP